ncbi:transposase [Sphingomonas sp. A2-49]|uniref:transposase n=1 Tax=Sphingomonas sp. A2-49 TaxID=1391375 RepID=UPI0021D021D5|nr:transposase [Sphingomonas sp. A2-49]
MQIQIARRLRYRHPTFPHQLHRLNLELAAELPSLHLYPPVPKTPYLGVHGTDSSSKAAALTFMKKTLKRHGSPEAITTDSLRSYRAAMNELGNAERQEVGRWANNRVENSHLPFRRRERAMLRFRQMKSLQKFASVHANVHNHFSLERHLTDRRTYKERRSAAVAEWQTLVS